MVLFMEHRLATKYILMQVTAHSALELYKVLEIHQLCTQSPRNVAIQSSRNSQIRGFDDCPFPLNLRSRTPRLVVF